MRGYARAMDPAKRKLAEGWGLNADSSTTEEILERLDMSVSQFVGLMRKGKHPSRAARGGLNFAPREALDSGDPKVRKLLLDRRWRK